MVPQSAAGDFRRALSRPLPPFLSAFDFLILKLVCLYREYKKFIQVPLLVFDLDFFAISVIFFRFFPLARSLDRVFICTLRHLYRYIANLAPIRKSLDNVSS